MSAKPRDREALPISLSASLRSQLQQARIFTDLELDKGQRRIGVCACNAGAGATSVALNLAAMLAERTGTPIALVEANLRSPALAGCFDLKAEPGFSAFASGLAGSEACRELPGMHVYAMLAEASDNPLPILKDAAARLSELSSAFQHMVLDLPPVLDYPDAGIMAAGIDGILLVLEAEETRWEVAREARNRLESAGIPLLGAVLNKKPHYVPDWLYRLL